MAVAAGINGCGGGEGDRGATQAEAGGADPQPAFYLTATNANELRRSARAAGERFARSQTARRAIMVLDFGAARLRHGVHGVALRGGTFFSNSQIAAAIEAAARGYHDQRRAGRAVTMVFAASNAFLSRPGRGYQAFDERLARRAGREQAAAVAGLALPRGVVATVGGDIEPGYDLIGRPEVSIALVAGANAGSRRPYYNVGTAPCEGRKCVNGWTPDDICEVAAGSGRRALPEIYTESPEDQPAQWAAIQRRCGIESFAGVSASPAGDISPSDSLERLRASTRAGVDPVIVVWPPAPPPADAGGAARGDT